MKLVNFSISLLLSACSCNVFAQTSYLCVPETSAGFTFNKAQQKWISTNFRVDGKKYFLNKSTQGKWEWKKFGETKSLERCDEDFDEFGYMKCELLHTITFNKTTLRFQKYYPVGYVNKSTTGNEGEDTPHIEIGTCSAIN